jgi:hypothetical protein
MSRIQYYLVTVTIPDDIGTNWMADYIRVAVQTWKGGMDPDSAIFNMESEAWTVKSVAKPL